MNIDTQRRNRIYATLILVLWLISFILSLGVIIFRRTDIPATFGPLLSTYTNIYAHTLAGMLGWFFSVRRENSVEKSGSHWLGLFGTLLVVFFLIPLHWSLWEFYSDRIDASDLLVALGQILPSLGFLVTGVIAYLFGKNVRPPS